MRKNNLKNKEKFLKTKRLLSFLLLLIILIFISIPLYKKLKLNLAVNSEVSGLKSEIEEVENNNDDLRELMKYFSTSEFIEEQAREKLGYRKENEKVAIIYKQDDKEDKAISSDKIEKAEEETETVNLLLWKKYFFKR